MRIRSVPLLIATLLLVAVPSAGAATPSVSIDSGLTPGFSRAVIDYVTKCPAGLIRLTANVPRGTSLKIDGKLLKAGRSVTQVKLSAGQRFILTSKVGSNATAHSIRCLPSDFPAFSVTGTLPATSPFMALSVPTLASLGVQPIPYAWVVDRNGVPVWWKVLPAQAVMDVKPIPGMKIGFWHGDLVTDIDNRGKFSEYTLDGKLARDVPVVDNFGLQDAHEALPIGFGHYYVVADVGRSHVDLGQLGGSSDQTVFDNLIEELDQNGKLVWTWNSGDHIPVSENARWLGLLTGPAGVPLLDAYHLNSVEEDGQGGLIVSFRYLDAIYRIDRSNGGITWKLGGSYVPGKSLNVIGDDAAGANHLMGQHDARIQPDGTITVFDNGSGIGERPPRATRWRIDPVARTATLVEQLSDPDAPSAYAGGSARLLSDGSWLVSWCHRPWIKAYSKTHKQVFALRFAGSGRSYRAAPISPTQMTRFHLLAGMDAQYPR